jgi:hypothetical protein
MWWLLDNGQVVNSAAIRILYVQQDGSDWVIMADLIGTETDLQLNGVFASQQDAIDARDRLVQMYDPANLG